MKQQVFISYEAIEELLQTLGIAKNMNNDQVWRKQLRIRQNRIFPIENEKTLENRVFFLQDSDLHLKSIPWKLKEDHEKYTPQKDTFHKAVSPVIAIGQLFGILPVILNKDYKKLRFSWLSLRFFYTIFSIFGGCVMVSFSIFNAHKQHNTGLRETQDIVFYASNLLSLYLFARMAPKWPSLVNAMANCEKNCKISELQNYKSQNGRSLSSRVAICSGIILTLALMEHIFSILSGVAVSIDCPFNNKPPVEAYFTMSFRQIFQYVTYSHWFAAYLEFTNIAMTMTWNFMDLFLIVISIALTDRFAKLNKYLFKYICKNMPEKFWKLAREEYTSLAQLVRTVDSTISEVILLSFANNLYFICLQLFNSLKNADEEDDEGPKCGRSKNGPLFGYSSAIYFGFSFTFLMTRSLAVCLAAAGLHSEAAKPNVVLYSVPSSSYCEDVGRFLEQVTTDSVSLTGMNFFNITRGLVLTIGGTVVTYELVLLQFNAPPVPVDANITISESCSLAAPPTVGTGS